MGRRQRRHSIQCQWQTALDLRNCGAGNFSPWPNETPARELSSSCVETTLEPRRWHEIYVLYTTSPLCSSSSLHSKHAPKLGYKYYSKGEGNYRKRSRKGKEEKKKEERKKKGGKDPLKRCPKTDILVHRPLASSPISEITHPLPEAAAARVKGNRKKHQIRPAALSRSCTATWTRLAALRTLVLFPPHRVTTGIPFRLRGRAGDVGDAMRVRPEGQARWQWGTPLPAMQSGEAELSSLTTLEPRKKKLIVSISH